MSRLPSSRTSLPLFALTFLLSPWAAGQEDHKLIASDGAAEDYFGSSVAICGNIAVIGAFQDDDNGLDSGAAYVFEVSTGRQLAKLLPSDGSFDDEFGWSVGVHDEIAIVGAPDDVSGDAVSGSAYLFDVTTGAQLAKLLPSDGEEDDCFGRSVAICNDFAIVGAFADDDNGTDSGSAYLFDLTTGAQIAKLLPSDGSSFDYFGNSVAISGDRAIVGAYFADDNGSSSGAAYVFDVMTGAQIAKLLPSDGEAQDFFGQAVAIHGGDAIVGAFYDDDNGFDSGSAYLFDVNTGTERAKLIASDGAADDYFGWSVGINDGIAIVGAPYNDSQGWGSGTAYLFDVATGTQTAKLLPSDSANYDTFGWSVAISDDNSLVGAKFDDDNGSGSGSAYLFLGQDFGPGSSFCFGDGSQAACPCGNTGGEGEGCANDLGSGALLTGSGSASLMYDDLVLTTSQLTPGSGLYFQGNNAVNGGDGNPFGDGLRCAGGGVRRLEVTFANAGNDLTTSTSVSIATEGDVSAGQTRHYQYWYRDSNGSPCGSGFNLSNAYEVTWTL
jgi:hypothetical protein